MWRHRGQEWPIHLPGAREYDGMKSERASTRAQATHQDPTLIPWGLPQANPAEPLIVSGPGADMLVKKH